MGLCSPQSSLHLGPPPETAPVTEDSSKPTRAAEHSLWQRRTGLFWPHFLWIPQEKKGFSALTEELQEPGGDGSSGCEHLTLGALRAVRAVPTLSGWRMKDGLHHSWDSTCRGVAAAGQRVKGPLSISEIPLKTRQSWKQPLSRQFLPRAATRTPSPAQQAGFRSDGIPASSRSPTLFPASSEAGASTALFTPLAPLYVGVGVSTTGSSC